MNTKKYTCSLLFMGILHILSSADITAKSPSATTPQPNDTTTLPEKVKKQKKGLNYVVKNIKKNIRCPYASTPLKKLKVEQLEEVYAYTQINKMDAAFMNELLERLIALSDNHAAVKQYKLQLADLQFTIHNLDRAAAYYEDFAVLYPGSKEYEYVLYKALACMFALSLDADRDQTNTRKTIMLAQEFLKNAQNPELIEEAQDVLQQCYNRLFDHEVYVFNFYKHKKNFVSAKMRLDYIAKTFVHTIPDIAKKVADLTAELEQAEHPVKLSAEVSGKNLRKKLLA